MSFGTESATPVGGQTLTGFIVSKAMQSRKDAKKADRKEKRKEKKEKEDKKENKQQKQGAGSKLLGSFPSLGNLFSYKKPETKSAQQTQTRTSGGGTGLAKILTQGFGSLTADTMGVASGLASVTQLLNSSLRAQSFTATGVQTIASILSDQVENQGSILSTVKSLKTGGGSGGGKSMFGSSRSKGVSGGTLTEALINAAIERGIGRFITSRLSRLNPFNRKPPTDTPTSRKPPTGGSNNPRGGYYDDAVATSKRNAASLRKQGIMQKLTDIGQGFKGKATQAADWGKGLVGKGVEGAKGLFGKAKGVGDNVVKGITSNPLSKRLGMSFAKFGGRMLPVAGTGFSAVEAADRAKKGDVVGAWLAGLGGGAGATATATSAAALTGAGAAVPAAAEVTSMAADIGLLGWDLVNAFNPKAKMAEGGVMIGEAGREAVVDLNSNQGRGLMGQQKGDAGMKASGAATLAVVDQFIKGMGALGSPVAQALGPDIQNLSRTFGMSQTLPNLRIGGGKFKEDGNAKKTRDKFLEELIAGSLNALDAKKKDERQQQQAPPSGDPNADRSQRRQSETEQLLENIPGAGKAMEIPAPSGVTPREGERAFQTQNTVRGTEVELASGKRLMVPSADLNPVTHSGKKYWYDNKGQIFKWSPGEKVTQVYLNQIQRQGLADGFDLVRNPTTGVVRQIPTARDWNPFNNANVIKAGEYSYRAHGVLTEERGSDGKPKWRRNTSEDDIQGIHGPTVAIPKQSNLTEFQRGGQVEQKPWWDFMGRFVDTHRNTKSQDYSNQKGLGANLARQREAMKQLGYEKGGSMFGTESSRVTPLEDRVKALEDIISVTAITSATEPKNQAPRSRPASTPIGVTSESSSDMSSAAIINIVGGMGGGSSVPVTSTESSQDSSEYISDPWPGGLAGVLCSSPWSAV